MTKPTPELLTAARALWDRGRTYGKEFSELTDNQRADLIADAAAIGDLISMAQEAKSYKVGYAYASAALVWARKERDRLSKIIRQCDDMNHDEVEG